MVQTILQRLRTESSAHLAVVKISTYCKTRQKPKGPGTLTIWPHSLLHLSSKALRVENDGDHELPNLDFRMAIVTI